MSKKHKKPQTEESNWVLESKLEPGMLRFMAHVIENGLNIGLRTEAEFIRHFPPADIMMGLADRPDLRANILVPATGIRAKIAGKKSAESAGIDLQIALDEGETDPALIVSLFHPDDRVRYLDQVRLWNYVIEPRFWEFTDSDSEQLECAKSHVAFILDRAIEDRMLTHREIVEGLSVANLVKHLPITDLQAVIEKALDNSHGGKPFTEQDLLSAVPAEQMVESVPLSLVWESVVRPMVAERNGLTGGAVPARASHEELVGTGSPSDEASSGGQQPEHGETYVGQEGGVYSPN